MVSSPGLGHSATLPGNHLSPEVPMRRIGLANLKRHEGTLPTSTTPPGNDWSNTGDERDAIWRAAPRRRQVQGAGGPLLNSGRAGA
jgi:hypothetical protein